jgi:hypothetical protein
MYEKVTNLVTFRKNILNLKIILLPIVCILLNDYSVTLFNGYKFGFEMLIVNGAFTFLGLWLIKEKE